MLSKSWPGLLWLSSSISWTDRVILSVAVVLVGWSYSYYWKGEGQLAREAIIFSPGQVPQQIGLDIPRHLVIRGRLGDSVIEIAQGKIRFTASPCQGKQCIHAGWLSVKGDFAACLPNQVSIQLDGETKFDALAY